MLRFLLLKASKQESVRSGSLTTSIFREILLVTASNPEIYRKTSQDSPTIILQSYLFLLICPLASSPVSLRSGHLKVMKLGSLQESASLLSTQGLCSCLSWCYFKSGLFYCIPLGSRDCLVLGLSWRESSSMGTLPFGAWISGQNLTWLGSSACCTGLSCTSVQSQP